uniref:Uncharacterized protein n=1 Tax=uncultured marine virus TaxID=186617 RepID=A0A0F7L6I8_9VIRU|nr:hypothetical protein [uncultured marine virus]
MLVLAYPSAQAISCTRAHSSAFIPTRRVRLSSTGGRPRGRPCGSGSPAPPHSGHVKTPLYLWSHSMQARWVIRHPAAPGLQP